MELPFVCDYLDPSWDDFKILRKDLQNKILVFPPNSMFIYNFSNITMPFLNSGCHLKKLIISISCGYLILMGMLCSIDFLLQHMPSRFLCRSFSCIHNQLHMKNSLIDIIYSWSPGKVSVRRNPYVCYVNAVFKFLF